MTGEKMRNAFLTVREAARRMEHRVFAKSRDDWDPDFVGDEIEWSHGEAARRGISRGELAAEIYAEVTGSKLDPRSLERDSDAGKAFAEVAAVYFAGRIREAEQRLEQAQGFADAGLLATIKFRCRQDFESAADLFVLCANRMDKVHTPTIGDVYRAMHFYAIAFRGFFLTDYAEAVTCGFSLPTREIVDPLRQELLEVTRLCNVGLILNARGQFAEAAEHFTSAIEKRTGNFGPVAGNIGDGYLSRAAARLNQREFDRAATDVDLAEVMIDTTCETLRALYLCRVAGFWELLGERARQRRCLKNARSTAVDRDVLDHFEETAIFHMQPPYLFLPADERLLVHTM